MGGRDRWISEVEASLVYILSSRTTRTVIQMNLISKKAKKKKRLKVRTNQPHTAAD